VQESFEVRTYATDPKLPVIPGESGQVLRHRNMSKKGLHSRHAHFARMWLVTKEDIAFNPVHICLLGAEAVVLEAGFTAHLAEQFLG
jgi:hypothetical protein